MYSGIKQSDMAKALLMSESNYNRKENGQLKIELYEARKMAKLLELNEKVVVKYWLADRLYELMKIDKELMYEALQIVDMYYDEYENFIELPSKNCSYSSLAERLQRRRKKL